MTMTMKWTTVTTFAAFFLAAILMTSGNAWGFGVDVRSDRWDNQSDHRWADRSDSWRNKRRGHAWDDDDSDADHAGPFEGDFAWSRGWLATILARPNANSNLNRRDRGWPSLNSGHAWWRDFLLNDGISDSTLADWFAFKKKLWILLLGHLHDHLHDHHDQPPQPVPLPAPLLLFGSGLIGLAGLLRRNKRLATGT